MAVTTIRAELNPWPLGITTVSRPSTIAAISVLGPWTKEARPESVYAEHRYITQYTFRRDSRPDGTTYPRVAITVILQHRLHGGDRDGLIISSADDGHMEYYAHHVTADVR